MTGHGADRRLLEIWTHSRCLLILAVIVGAAWVLTLALTARVVIAGRQEVGILRGCLYWSARFPGPREPFLAGDINPDSGRHEWWPALDLQRTPAGLRGGGGYVSLWTPLSLVLILIVVRQLRQQPSASPGHCFACGYDRRELPAERPCPECGSPGLTKFVWASRRWTAPSFWGRGAADDEPDRIDP